MKRTLRFWSVSLAPLVIIIGYSGLYHFSKVYTQNTFSPFLMLATPIVLGLLVGLALFFLCKSAFRKHKKLPIEYLLGLLCIVIANARWLYLPISLPSVFLAVTAYGITLSSLMISVYICLFVFSLRRYLKTRKQLTDHHTA